MNKISDNCKIDSKIIENDIEIGDFCVVGFDCSIGSGTKIGESCQIKDGSIIGTNCQIGDNCTLPENCKIGHYVKIDSNVHLMMSTNIPSFAHIFTNSYNINDIKVFIDKFDHITTYKFGSGDGAGYGITINDYFYHHKTIRGLLKVIKLSKNNLLKLITNLLKEYK